MIDSHCHLDHEPMYSDLENVISRSKNVGVEKILSICTTIESFNKILKIIDIDSIIYGTFGIHPHECSDNKITKNEIINYVNQNKKIIAIKFLINTNIVIQEKQDEPQKNNFIKKI